MSVLLKKYDGSRYIKTSTQFYKNHWPLARSSDTNYLHYILIHIYLLTSLSFKEPILNVSHSHSKA